MRSRPALGSMLGLEPPQDSLSPYAPPHICSLLLLKKTKTKPNQSVLESFQFAELVEVLGGWCSWREGMEDLCTFPTPCFMHFLCLVVTGVISLLLGSFRFYSKSVTQQVNCFPEFQEPFQKIFKPKEGFVGTPDLQPVKSMGNL